MSLPPLPPGFTLDGPERKPKTRRAEPLPANTRPTGEAHDGDTFRLDTGDNARLYGVDAFELDQTGRTRGGETSLLGAEARAALLPYLQPSATVAPTGASTYGRPVASLELNGLDAGLAQLRAGYGIATPEYLKVQPSRFRAYMEAERNARLNRRGAWAGSFQPPSSYRHGTPNPWDTSEPTKPGERQAVFWDEPLPAQGLRPDIAEGYIRVWQDMSSKPDDLMAYAQANGFSIDRKSVVKAYAERAKTKRPGSEVTYNAAPPRVLTDNSDGATGAALRGFADPVNVLDEAGALADTLLPGNGRENIWSSDRRFGDVYANNLDQNRSILAYDDANHPYARFGGQLVGGLALPSLSAEGVGFTAARKVLENGGGRFAANMAARRAVTGRLGLAGALEGTAAGVGQGETWQERASGGMVGSVAGAALGTATGLAAPKIAELVGRPFSRLAGRDGEEAADRMTDGAVDAARARASDGATAEGRAIERNPETGRRVYDFGSMRLPTRARKAIRARQGLSPTEGQYGPIHYNLADPRRWRTATAKLAADDTGELPGAIQHPEIGKVDVVWGSDDVGLKSIVERDPDMVGDLPRLVEELPVVERPNADGSGRYVLADDTQRVVISPEYEGDTKRWMVASYQRTDDEAADALPELPEGLTLDDPAAVDGTPASAATEAMDADLSRPSISAPVAAPERPGALLAPVSNDLREAQAADLRAGDVLPLPANTVDGIGEAERIAAGRMEPVRAPNEADTLGRRTIPNATTGAPIAKRGPLDLVSWLRSQGGIRAQGGELERYGIDNAGRKGVDFAGGENRLGPLVANDGMTYDEAAERAWEAGFFPDRAERPTVADFLDTLADTHSGRQRAFRPDDLGEVDAFDAARRERIDVEGARAAGAPMVRDRSEPVGMDDLDANAPPVRAYEEWGENAPNLAGNIRLDKLDSPQAIKRALIHTEQRAGGFDAARRGRITQAETASLAEELGMTADDLLKRRKGQALNAEEALAARQLLARSSADLVNMARRMTRIDNPGDEMEAAFKEAWLRHSAIQEQVAGMTAEAGRALAQFRQIASAKAVGRVLPNFGEMAGGTARMKDVAERIIDLEQVGKGPGEINKFALKASRVRGRDMLVELYYNSLLSGPTTHAVNILSNTLTSVSQIPEYATAAAIGAARRGIQRGVSRSTGADVGRADRVLASEVGARTVGLLQGTKIGLVEAWRTLRTGVSSDPFTKVEVASDEAIPGRLGKVLRAPTRALAAEDELFKGIARQMALNGLATRRVGLSGLKGEEAKRAIADLIDNPPDDLQREARDYSRYATFTKPLGPAGRYLSAATESYPAAKLIVPFIRTPLNIFKYAVERSPLAPLLGEWRRDLQAGGARGDLAMAKMMIGSGIGAMMIEAALAGHITGGGPADDGAKRLMMADGWQPYSFKVGDQYYSYARLDPLALTIGTAVDMVDLQSSMTDKQRENAASLVAASIAGNLSNKTWLSGISNMAEALNDPDRSWGRFVNNMAAGIAVPAVVGQVNRVNDPLMREARTMTDAIRSRVPGLSDSLAVRRDVFGAEVRRPDGLGPDLFSPVRTGTARNDPTVAALLDAGVQISKPLRKLGKDRVLSDAEYDRYQEVIGFIAKPRLDSFVKSGKWRALSDEDKQTAVTSLMKKARVEARVQLFGVTARKRSAASPADLPPLPPGFKMDELPPLPAGLTLDR